MHRIDLTPIYVLHTRPFRNTSLLVDLFSKQYGRIIAVARSARGPKSRYQGKLQLFTPMLAAWSARHELKSLGNVELHDAPLQLNHEALFCAFYLNELLTRLLQKEDPHPILFDVYHQTLLQLSTNHSIPKTLRLFEKRLLERLGYALPLARDASTGAAIQSDQLYRYEPNQGFYICDRSKSSMDNTVFSGECLQAIAENRFDTGAILQSAKRLMRLSFSALLGNKPLNSAVFF